MVATLTESFWRQNPPMFHYLFLIINIAGVRRVLRLRRPPRCIMQLLFGRRRCQLPSHEVGRLSKVRSLQSSPFPPARFDADISQEGRESGWWWEGTGGEEEEEEEAWLFGAGLSGGLGRFFSEKITGCYQVGEKNRLGRFPVFTCISLLFQRRTTLEL